MSQIPMTAETHLRGRKRVRIQLVQEDKSKLAVDTLVVEEPLEIRLGPQPCSLAVTMRTPGDDFDLVAGFLYNEGIISRRSDLLSLRYCASQKSEDGQQQNIINVELAEATDIDLAPLQRHFFMGSSCGVCGKASIDSLRLRGARPIEANFQVNASVLFGLPERLRGAQRIFASTGGLHASGLFDREGTLLRVREDIGRHNALDKLIGALLLAEELPLRDSIVITSGRASFEVLQKCIMAGAPMVCAVSAPSSLAVSLAEAFGVTLVGFLRDHRFNLYAGSERVLLP
jgi:FdhD protein